MTDVNDLHQKAMSLVDEAHLARLNGSEEQYLELTEAAFMLEAKAAWALAGEIELEPTRSVLFRSAASLALEIRKPREAEQLIAVALLGAPPDEIANELRDLLEDVYFARHLDLRGVTLAPGELQMTIELGKLTALGESVWDWIKANPDFCGDELNLTLMPMAEKAGLCKYETYDPEKHGEFPDLVPGEDELYYWRSEL